MTNKIHRTEINIETHEFTIIRTRGRQHAVYCESCQTTVLAFTTGQISEFLRLVEGGEIHLIETSRGTLVCGKSLDHTNK